ncbi:MAG: hypothetical protein IT422_08005 [Pirellulaceae bacterium]|jgi:hypothetical protein|nr:hypothetical protein [Pirellulaceae bacterium]
MKKLTLLTVAALSCCAFSPTFAQVQILRSETRPSAPRLVSDRTELNNLDPFADTTEDSQESTSKIAIPNPFDYFSEDLPTVEPKPAISDNSSNLLTEEQSLLESDLPSNSRAPQSQASKRSTLTQELDTDDAASIPVGLHHRRNSSVVDTIIDQATLGSIPHCATTPIDWGTSPHTPNAVADWLLREQCVAGLWDGYPQQRAAECARMWARLAGHSTCRSGCATVSGPCTVCAQHPQVRRNRYTGGFSTAPMGCEPCNSCPSIAAPCDADGPAAPAYADSAQMTPGSAPEQLVKTDVNNVAQLPSLPIYR